MAIFRSGGCCQFGQFGFDGAVDGSHEKIFVIGLAGQQQRILSSCSMLIRLTSACPLPGDPSRSSGFGFENPARLVNRSSWVLAVNKWAISSSSLVVIPVAPYPAVLSKESSGILALISGGGRTTVSSEGMIFLGKLTDSVL
jgi:hypothetical protein